MQRSWWYTVVEARVGGLLSRYRSPGTSGGHAGIHAYVPPRFCACRPGTWLVVPTGTAVTGAAATGAAAAGAATAGAGARAGRGRGGGGGGTLRP